MLPGDGAYIAKVKEINQVSDSRAIMALLFYIFTACRKKKLVQGVCPTCQGSDSVWTYRAKVSVVRLNFSKDTTLFEGDLKKLFGQLPKETDEDLLFTMVEMLPISFMAKFAGSNFYNIIKK